ncbi:MAG: 4Fe-4S cluster-binding domain-containing protein [Planctomycetota bacterium]|nr:4Fe-4S cluster-binding domain-containing protein [Planctomycetota bacterium]
MFQQFGLVLMLTHACNLRCSYCYNGRGSSGTMSLDLGRRSIDRAIASLAPGGTYELAFFGCEPSLHVDLLSALID